MPALLRETAESSDPSTYCLDKSGSTNGARCVVSIRTGSSARRQLTGTDLKKGPGFFLSLATSMTHVGV